MALLTRTGGISSAALAVGVLVGCATAPVTDRDQFIIVSEQQANAMGASAYQQIRAEKRVSDDRRLRQLVDRVGRRIAAVADDPGYRWELTLFEDPSPNAFALPGGRIGVNTGLFNVARSEAQLAAVIAHEMAHVVARHPSERLSRQVAVQGGLALVGAASGAAAQHADLLAQAATLGLILPFSRNQESEADRIGLIYMARAGYDPRAAIEVWQNFQAHGGARPPEFLATHPSPGNRLERLRSYMPEAMQIYRG
jgi:metalloendopeptidase OMA1, mitochondrial